MSKITKQSAKNVGLQAGAIATGIVGGHLVHSLIPEFENPTVNIAVPFGVSGAAAVGAMAVANPFAKTALTAVSVFSFLKGARRLVDKLATPNAEGKAVISESLKKGIDYVVPSLGCPIMPISGLGKSRKGRMGNPDQEFLPTIDLGNIMPLANVEEAPIEMFEEGLISVA